jgi:hypothetical protein
LEHQNGFANSIPLFDEMPRSLTNDSLDTPAGLTISEIKPRVISLRVQVSDRWGRRCVNGVWDPSTHLAPALPRSAACDAFS